MTGLTGRRAGLDIEKMKAFVYDRFGIKLSDSKLDHLEAKLERQLEKNGLAGGLGDFYRRLADGQAAALDDLVRVITTGHTFFFRESDHFDFLADWISKSSARGGVIWCAACSTGEEPYSIAITLLEKGIKDFHILASDLNKGVLKRFNDGIYHSNRLDETSKYLRLKYFKAVGEDRYRVDPGLRSRVSIRCLNLMDSFRLEEQADYVFCRNVLIYFDAATRKKALLRVTENLRRGGLLFLGHTEPIMEQDGSLERVGASIYRKL